MEQQAALGTYEMVKIVLSIAVPFAGALYAVFKYSVGRNIEAADAEFASLKKQISGVESKLDDLKHSYGKEGMTRGECSACRKECSDRVAVYQHQILEWMRRQDDKADRILMMVADRNRKQRFIDSDEG